LSNITELDATNSAALCLDVREALKEAMTFIDVDLSQTRLIDSSGLGALITLHKTMCARGGGLRVLNPAPNVKQILELTRLNRVFEIVQL
jgi:anti-sigma B factor antagonist